jgi:hypothetical protein
VLVDVLLTSEICSALKSSFLSVCVLWLSVCECAIVAAVSERQKMEMVCEGEFRNYDVQGDLRHGPALYKP